MIEEIYKRQVDSIFRLSMVYLKNIKDAEDAVQNVFLKYIESSTIFKNEEAEKRWFLKTTKNYCLDVLKSSWKRKTDLGYIPNEATEDYSKEDGIVLEKIMFLPKKYREVIYLYYYEEYKIKEISEILDRKESTIQTQLFNGRKRLKKLLLEEGIVYE